MPVGCASLRRFFLRAALEYMLAMVTQDSHLRRGSAVYRRATLALFCAGFATFALLYCIQPLLPLLTSLWFTGSIMTS